LVKTSRYENRFVSMHGFRSGNVGLPRDSTAGRPLRLDDVFEKKAVTPPLLGIYFFSEGGDAGELGFDCCATFIIGAGADGPI
jgi:hypothetical protein